MDKNSNMLQGETQKLESLGAGVEAKQRDNSDMTYWGLG